MKPLRCAIYARVSTDGQSTALQLADLRPYILARRWEPVGEYVDEGVSGAKTSRPRLDALMADVKHGKIDIVLVWKFDRMGRNTGHLVSVLDDLHNHGVEFCSFTEQLDTSTPMGKCMFTIIAALAELERATTMMRSKAGVENARRNGKRFGRPEKHDLPIAVIEQAMRTHGGQRQAAKALGVAVSTLRYRMRNISNSVVESAPQVTTSPNDEHQPQEETVSI